MFARRIGENADSTPLSGDVERWLGEPGDAADRQLLTAITDTSADSVSPYANYARQGAIVVPRCLFFVNEAANPAIIQAGQTVTVDPRRGPQDKEPWKKPLMRPLTHSDSTERRLPSDSEGVGGINPARPR